MNKTSIEYGDGNTLQEQTTYTAEANYNAINNARRKLYDYLKEYNRIAVTFNEVTNKYLPQTEEYQRAYKDYMTNNNTLYTNTLEYILDCRKEYHEKILEETSPKATDTTLEEYKLLEQGLIETEEELINFANNTKINDTTRRMINKYAKDRKWQVHFFNNKEELKKMGNAIFDKIEDALTTAPYGYNYIYVTSDKAVRELVTNFGGDASKIKDTDFEEVTEQNKIVAELVKRFDTPTQYNQTHNLKY